jgi:hypothetical protein
MHTCLWEKIISSLCIGLFPESIGLKLFGCFTFRKFWMSYICIHIYILFLNRLKTRRLLRPLAHVSLRRRGCNGTKGLRDSIIYLGGTIMNIYI